MTDDDRIKRLTELAKRAWPNENVSVTATAHSAGVHRIEGNEAMVAMVLAHPRSLEALEAALLVLAGDDTRMELGRLRERVRDVLAEELAKRKATPAWVESLAAQWEQEARSVREIAKHCEHADEDGQLHLIWVAEAYDKRAVELRQAAKGAP